jgi:hypothetical protein
MTPTPLTGRFMRQLRASVFIQPLTGPRFRCVTFRLGGGARVVFGCLAVGTRKLLSLQRAPASRAASAVTDCA